MTRSEIFRECRSEIQAESRSLAEYVVTVFPPPWPQKVRESLSKEIDVATGVALQGGLLTLREKRRLKRDAVRVFEERLAELIARGSNHGHA